MFNKAFLDDATAIHRHFTRGAAGRVSAVPRGDARPRCGHVDGVCVDATYESHNDHPNGCNFSPSTCAHNSVLCPQWNRDGRNHNEGHHNIHNKGRRRAVLQPQGGIILGFLVLFDNFFNYKLKKFALVLKCFLYKNVSYCMCKAINFCINFSPTS